MTTLLPLADAPTVCDTASPTTAGSASPEDRATFGALVDGALADDAARIDRRPTTDGDRDGAGDDSTEPAEGADPEQADTAAALAATLPLTLVLALPVTAAPVVDPGHALTAGDGQPIASTAPAPAAPLAPPPPVLTATEDLASVESTLPPTGADTPAGAHQPPSADAAPLAPPSRSVAASAPVDESVSATPAAATPAGPAEPVEPIVANSLATSRPAAEVHAPVVPEDAVAPAPSTAPTPLPTAAREPVVAPSSAARPPEPAAAPESRPWEQIAHVVRSVDRGADGSHRITVRLDPPELGTVDVEVRVHDGRLSVHATSDSAATRDLIARSLPELRVALEASGLHTGSLDVGARSMGHGATERDGSAAPGSARAASEDRGESRDPERPDDEPGRIPNRLDLRL